MDTHEYRELKIRVERNPEGGFKTYAEGPSGEASGTLELPLSEDELMKTVYELGRRMRGALEDTLAEDFGAQLFDALFQGQIRDLYHESFARAQAQGKGLRITLGLTDVPELMQLPWEFLYHEPDFLAISDWTPVVRYLDLPTAREPLAVEPPLHILAMVSSPSNAVPLDVERERTNLERALRELVDAGAVEISWLEKATLPELQKTLRRGTYHVFHFIGHGAFDEQAKDGMLLLEDDMGRGRFVRGQNLGKTLANHKWLRLAVLNSCEGGRSADDDPFAGVASSLVRAQIPAVLAMQFEISDRAAAIFAGGLYESLADGYPVDAALSQARLAIFNDPNPLEWGTPVLLMRVPDGKIFDVAPRKPRPPKPKPKPPPPPPPPPPSRLGRLGRWLGRRRWWLAAGGGAVLLAAALVGLFVWLADGSGTWSRASVDTAVPDNTWVHEIRGIAPLAGGEAVAVGLAADESGVRHPFVWTFDGSSWVGRPLTFERDHMNGVAAGGGTIVAVGAVDTGEGTDAGIWRLSGTEWEFVCSVDCEGDGAQVAYAVALRPSDRTFVAVGRSRGSSDDKNDAAVWLSDDGSEWRRSPQSASLGGNGNQEMKGVVEIGGVLVAVGRDRRDAAVWTSTDGNEWTKVERQADLVAQGLQFLQMDAVAKVGSKLIAVGSGQSQGHRTAAAAWISFDDGSTWRRESSADFTPRGQRMLGVSESCKTPSEAIVVGFDRGGTVAAVWHYSDGEGWTSEKSSSFAVDLHAEMSDVAAVGTTLFAVGQSGETQDPNAAIWESGVCS